MEAKKVLKWLLESQQQHTTQHQQHQVQLLQQMVIQQQQQMAQQQEQQQQLLQKVSTLREALQECLVQQMAPLLQTTISLDPNTGGLRGAGSITGLTKL